MIATARPTCVDGGALPASGMPAIASSRVQLPMSISQPSTSDPSTAPTRRVPTLITRNHSDDTAISDVSLSSGGGSSSSSNDIRRLRLRTALSPHSASSVRSPSDGRDEHSTHGSVGSQGRERPHRHQSSRKRSTGVMGFLTLKEPSTSALEEFAEHEKRKAAQKGARSVAMAMPGVSSQRLPDHVPKVNSKWDGLPEVPKKKHAERKERDTASPIDLKHFSLGRSASGRASAAAGPYASLSSRPSVRRSGDKKRLSVVVTEVDEQTHSPPLPTAAMHPAVRRSAIPAGPTSPDDLILPDLSGYTTTSPMAAPPTSAVDTAMPYPHPSTRAANAVAPWISDSDDVTVNTAGPNVLSPPRLRRNYQPVAAASPMSPGSRSPRTPNISSFTYSTTPSSLATSDRSLPLPLPSPASGSTSSSSGSSELSAQWKAPPKQRLSLDPQVKKDQVLPWEVSDAPPPGDFPPRRPSATDSNKLKRLSYRLGGGRR